MKNKCKAALSFVLAFTIAFSCMLTSVLAASGIPEQPYFSDDFSTGSLDQWEPVENNMQMSEVTVTDGDGTGIYQKMVCFTGENLILTPKPSAVAASEKIYSVTYTVRPAPLQDDTVIAQWILQYTNEGNYTAYQLFCTDAEQKKVILQQLKCTSGVSTTQNLCELQSAYDYSGWFEVKISKSEVALTQGTHTDTAYNHLDALEIYMSGKGGDFAEVNATYMRTEDINFSSSADYWIEYKGTKSNMKIESDAQDGYIVSFTADNTYVKADSSLTLQEDAFTIQYMEMQVKTNGTKPIEIFTAYEDDRNYSYAYIVQNTSSSYIQFYNVVNGVSTRVNSYNNIPRDDIDFYSFVTVQVDMITPGHTLVSFLKEGEEGLKTVARTYDIETSAQAKELVIGSSTANTTQYRNIHVFAENSDKYASVFKEVRKFSEKYEELSRLDAQTVTVNYQATVEAFLSDYSALSKTAQYRLSLEKLHVTELERLIEKLVADGAQAIPPATDYSDFTDDFENGLGNWIDATALDADLSIVYDETLQSNVLKVFGNHYNESGATLKSFLKPEASAITKISFKVRFDDVPMAPLVGPKIAYSYSSSGVYSIFHFFDWPDTATGGTAYRWASYENGASSGIYQNLYNTVKYDVLGTWFDVEIFYSGDVATVFYYWDKGTEDEYVVNFNCSGANPVGASVALLARMNGSESNAAYYDDVTVSWEAARVDDEEYVNEDITIYSTGNTAQYPDDVVQVTGEDLYENVSRIEIAPIENDPGTAGYILQNTPESTPRQGKFTTASTPTWNEASAEELAILQPDEDSFKFVLPADFAHGIYALKAYGYQDQSDAEDVVLYINRPRVEQKQGDEGDISTVGGKIVEQGDGTRTISGGYLQLIGENLALAENNGFVGGGPIQVQFKNASTTRIFTGDQILVNSKYSLMVPIPSDMPVGDYEVMVYNGFGDSTCWSEPVTVTIGVSPRAAWPTEVFNLQKDYGASGQLGQNATPYFVNALADIAENGGGILYIPKGQYILRHTIIIPENVTVLGDGQDETIILWIPDQWEFGGMPSALVYATDNIAIEDIGFYATRMPNMFTFVEKVTGNKNIYFSNCTMYTNPYTADATGGNVSSGHIYDSATLQLMVTNEGTGYFFRIGNTKNRSKNVRFENNWLFHGPLLDTTSYWVNADYAYFCNNTVWNGCYASFQAGTSLVYMNNTFEAMAHEMTGYGAYSQNNTYQNTSNNNRELHVADHVPEANDITMVSTQNPDVYSFVNKPYGTNDLVGYQIYVYDGPGKGSTRIITGNSGTEVQLDTPLAVTANMDTKITLRIPRQHQFFVDNTFYNGCAGGFFGGCSDVIYDGNTFSRVTTQYQQAIFGDNNFYISYVDNTFIDPFALFNYGYAENSMQNWVGPSYIELHSTISNKSYGHSFCRNTLDGYKLRIFGFVNKAMRNVVVAKNSFANVETAVEIRQGSSAYDNGGIIFYKNVTENVSQLCNQLNSTYRNDYGAKLIENLVSSAPNEGFVRGDVNGDGAVSLKDCTMLRYALAGRLTLTAAQISRGDINDSGIISLKDIAAIRNYLMTGTFKTDYTDSVAEAESSAISSSSSSGTSSSGSTSSSASSSSTSSSASSSSISSSRPDLTVSDTNDDILTSDTNSGYVPGIW